MRMVLMRANERRRWATLVGTVEACGRECGLLGGDVLCACSGEGDA